jgi:hypothetical protein
VKIRTVTAIGILAVWSSASLSGASVQLERRQHQIEVAVDGKPFTTYFFDPDVAKPYFMPLRTASGEIITRGFPVGNDATAGNPKSSSFEPHQRPLYFGHGNVDGLDFWGEAAFERYYDDHAHQAYGHMTLKSIEEAKAAKDSATIRARFTLNDPNNRIVGEETQSFAIRGDEHTRTIDCVFVLHAIAGPLVMGDTKEGTFGIRLARELSAPHDHMMNSNGVKGEKAIWGKPADWVNYDGEIGGNKVGIAVFDHPKSFRHPTTWHARAYGLFAANPFGLREFTNNEKDDGSWTIPEGQSLTFRYRVFIHDGSFSVTELNQAYRQYAAEP